MLVVQQIDGLAVAPRLMGDQLDLHPLLIILSFLVGATLFGIPGMILSVPVAAVIKGVFVYWVERAPARPIFSEDGVLFRRRRTSAPRPTARAESKLRCRVSRPRPTCRVDSHRSARPARIRRITCVGGARAPSKR